MGENKATQPDFVALAAETGIEPMYRALATPCTLLAYRCTSGAHQRERRPSTLRTPEISAAGQDTCGGVRPRSPSCLLSTRPTGRLTLHSRYVTSVRPGVAADEQIVVADVHVLERIVEFHR
jgi:hypothetical protein